MFEVFEIWNPLPLPGSFFFSLKSHYNMLANILLYLGTE